ncbi:MAG: malonate decarboxylase acyl carrier protein [Leptothrix sp. (in: b-proteobacteria)]
MSNAVGIETMTFDFSGSAVQAARDAAHPAVPPAALVGVVGSGNLEVMIEAGEPGRCAITVETSARGFRPIWDAVLHDFHARHALTGVRVSINDMGATPAVVSLRLDQAVAEWAARRADAPGASA